MRQINTLVVHCTATPQTTTIASIQRHWRDVLKWRSMGYHVIIEANGSVTQLAPDSAVCNGVAGHNATSLHVSYIGGIDSRGRAFDNRTQAQKDSLLRVLKEWKRMYPNAVIRGHRDFAKKACPSFDARAEYASI
jgi:N-acetylmuramoyl-L-alanine amidase